MSMFTSILCIFLCVFRVLTCVYSDIQSAIGIHDKPARRYDEQECKKKDKQECKKEDKQECKKKSESIKVIIKYIYIYNVN